MSDPLDDLDALLAAATPGPWRHSADEAHLAPYVADPHGHTITILRTPRGEADARLIAALRNAAPDLLAVARAAAGGR